MIINIPQEVKYVISELKEAGYEAYLVGGCVRDSLMGKAPKDYDVTSNAKPEEVTAVFSSTKVIDTGSTHGTVTVIRDGIHVEVTTFRKESIYSDGRHPDKVVFSDSIEEDLSRRDFTINAMAYNDERGLIDLFGGASDIENKIIRTVREPKERFGEDSLRMLRAIRFASTLGFKIEEKTKNAICEKKNDIATRVSSERIQKELEGILMGEHVEEVLREYVGVIGIIIPEILPMVGFDQKTPFHIYDVWEHTIKVVSGMPAEPSCRLAGLFHDIGKPPCFTQGEDGVGHFFGHPDVSSDMARDIMRRLKFDNATMDEVLILVKWHDLRPEPTEKAMRRVIMKVTPELFDKWIAIKRADNGAQSPMLADRRAVITELEKIGRSLIESEEALSLKTLKINGRDIMSMGISEGPKVGEIMSKLLDMVLEEEIPNEREALLERAQALITL